MLNIDISKKIKNLFTNNLIKIQGAKVVNSSEIDTSIRKLFRFLGFFMLLRASDWAKKDSFVYIKERPVVLPV